MHWQSKRCPAPCIEMLAAACPTQTYCALTTAKQVGLQVKKQTYISRTNWSQGHLPHFSLLSSHTLLNWERRQQVCWMLTARQTCCPQQTSFLQTCFRIRSLTHPSLLWFPPQDEKVALTAASHALSGKCPCSRGRAASQRGSTWTDLCGCRDRSQV